MSRKDEILDPTIELLWRKVRTEDGAFADWVRDLSDLSGVYLIRSDPTRFTEELLYIGESHTYAKPGRKRTYRGLYRTLTRHFHGHDWSQGITYDPDDVEVAVIITTPEQAPETIIDYQDLLIAMYQPRDNEHVKQMRLSAWNISPDDLDTDDPGYPSWPDDIQDSETDEEIPF